MRVPCGAGGFAMSYTLADQLEGKPMFAPYGNSMMCLLHESTFAKGGKGCYYCLKNKPQSPEEKFDREFRPHTDITAGKHRGNGHSAAANPPDSAKAHDMRKIYEAFCAAGSGGSIAEDIYLPLGFLPQTGSARCSDLKRQGKLVPALDAYGKRRSGTTKT